MKKKGKKDMNAKVELADDYRPAEDEPFMNDRQMEYFRRKLLNWKAELLDDSKSTIEEFLLSRQSNKQTQCQIITKLQRCSRVFCAALRGRRRVRARVMR